MKEKISTLLIAILLLLVCFTICFGVGYKKGKRSTEIQKDTITIEKIIVKNKPQYSNENVLSLQKIKVPTFIILQEYQDSSKQTIINLKHSLDSLLHSTDSLELMLHRVQRYYVEENYEAWVSGIDPLLDSIKIKQNVQQIINTTTIKENKFDFNVGLNANGWNKSSYCLNPNINISYFKNKFTLTGEIGFNVPIYDMSKTLPYVQVGVNYSLWSF